MKQEIDLSWITSKEEEGSNRYFSREEDLDAIFRKTSCCSCSGVELTAVEKLRILCLGNVVAEAESASAVCFG